MNPDEHKMTRGDSFKSVMQNMAQILGSLPSRQEFATFAKQLIQRFSNLETEIRAKIARIKEGTDGKDGRDGKDGAQGPKGDKGDKGDRGPQGIPGFAVFGGKGADGKDGKDGSPDTAEQIVEKINSSEETINKERIEGLEDAIKALRQEIATKTSGGVRRVFQPYVDDFSALTDGSTKTFTLSREPLRTNTIQVFGTDFPTILRPTTDFTVSGKTLTLTAAVPAPNTGATLLIHYYA